MGSRPFHLVFGLRMGKAWFSGPIRHELELDIPVAKVMSSQSDRLPAPEHRGDYRDWIGALVERYDGDGRNDMPGLRWPVRHLQVGNEYANPMFWTGTVDDYETLLDETLATARAASPEVVIVSNGIRWNDLFHGDPDGTRFEERFSAFLDDLPSDAWRREWRHARRLTEKTVALADRYQVLDAGGNGPYPTASEGYLAWVRAELAKTGANPDIWDMEARSEPNLACAPGTCFHEELLVPQGRGPLDALGTPRHRDHARAVDWYRAEQARVLGQVFATRFGAGFERVFMGMPDDWDHSLAALTTPNPYIGLCDRDGRPWPALAALRMLVAKLDGFQGAERLRSHGGVALFRFTFDDSRGPAYVAWLEESCVRGLDDPLPSRRVALRPVATPAVATALPTSAAAPRPERFAAGEAVSLDLGPTPVIIEEAAAR